jgi:uncharacterized C2H2 Zn-finger protein
MKPSHIAVSWKLCFISDLQNANEVSNRQLHEARDDGYTSSSQSYLFGQSKAVPSSGNQLGQGNRYVAPWSVCQFNSEMPFTCPICGKGYVSKSGYYQHVRAHKGKQFTCPVCDTKFTHRFSIKSHLLNVHNASQCRLCSKVFTIGDEYDSHIRHCMRFWNFSTPSSIFFF